MKLKGTVVRAYVAEGLTGQNARLNGRPVIHVTPDDPEALREIDGSHQAGVGEVRVPLPHGTTGADLPPVGETIEVDFDASPLR